MEKKTIFDLNRCDLDQYKVMHKLPLRLVLDNIRSLNNIGSMFRTSDAFLVERIHLCGITATPPSVEIHKTALGAENSVDWSYHATTMDAIDQLRREGYTVCALEQVKESIPLDEYDVRSDAKYAIVVGHEVDGVDPQVVNACDAALEIPQMGTKHSLNVAVSAGLALWTFFTALRPR